MDSIPMDVPEGAASAAACSSIRLNDARRRLPHSPMMVATLNPLLYRVTGRSSRGRRGRFYRRDVRASPAFVDHWALDSQEIVARKAGPGATSRPDPTHEPDGVVERVLFDDLAVVAARDVQRSTSNDCPVGGISLPPGADRRGNYAFGVCVFPSESKSSTDAVARRLAVEEHV